MQVHRDPPGAYHHPLHLPYRGQDHSELRLDSYMYHTMNYVRRCIRYKTPIFSIITPLPPWEAVRERLGPRASIGWIFSS